MHTLDKLANTNPGVEVAAANAAVELLALAARGVLVVEVAGVLHGDVVTSLGLVLAVAGGDKSLLDTHVDCCASELAGVDWGECCRERGRKSGAGEEAEGHDFSRRKLRFVRWRPGTQEEGHGVGSGSLWASMVELAFGRQQGELTRTDSYTKTRMSDDAYEPRGERDVCACRNRFRTSGCS